MIALKSNQITTIEIDLGESFERIVANLLSLPAGCSERGGDAASDEADLRQVIRGLYEAANGRHVETTIGLVAIAPPAFEFLKTQPFRVATQNEFLIEAAARVLAGRAVVDSREETADVLDNKPSYETAAHYRPVSRATTQLLANAA